MRKHLAFDVKEMMVTLSGACFWYWNSFNSFLDSSGVPRRLQSRYPRESFNKYEKMRNILNDLEEAGNEDVINRLVSNLYRLRGPMDREKLDVRRASELLGEFRTLVGDDPIQSEIERREREKVRTRREESIKGHQSRQRNLDKMSVDFNELVTSSNITPQARGFALERLLFELLTHFEFECHQPYRTPSGEQIDGHFRYEKFDYLVEVKWTEGLTKSPDLSVFDGKIRDKAQSTRGLFVSANGFAEKAIAKFSGNSPRIVLMTGEDLALVLSGRTTLDDAMRAKIDALVRKGEIFYPLRGVR